MIVDLIGIALNGVRAVLWGGCWLLFLLPASRCLASVDGEAKPSALAHITIIAVGPVPPRRYATKEESAEDAALLPPLQGAVPPAHLYYRVLAADSGLEPSDDKSSGEASTEGKKKRTHKVRWQSFAVGFNRGSQRFTAPAGQPMNLFVKNQSANGGFTYEKYCQLPALKPGSERVVFLTAESSSVRSWLGKINLSMLDVASQTLRSKGILLKNFSHRQVQCSVGQRKSVVLMPGRRRSYELNHQRRYYRIHAETKNRQTIINTSLPVAEQTITLLVFYSTGVNHRVGKSIAAFRATVKRGP